MTSLRQRWFVRTVVELAYTGAGASGRHPRPREGLRPPRHRSGQYQDDLFSCPGERTTGAYGRAVARPGKELVMTAHRTAPPVRAMRDNPDIDQLKRQAKELLEAYRAQSPDAVNEVIAHHRT